LVRSADDFIVTGASRELLETEVRSVIESFLHERGLVHSAEKSKITHVREIFDFRGQTLRKFSPIAEVQREARFALNFGVRVYNAARGTPATLAVPSQTPTDFHQTKGEDPL